MARREIKNVPALGNIVDRLDTVTTTVQIEIDKLSEHPDNEFLFGEITDDNIDNLVQGIKKNGFMGTIWVWREKNNNYTIFSGHRRVRALKKLGKKTAPCTIYEKPKDILDQKMILLGSNIYTRGSINATENHILIARQLNYLEECIPKEADIKDPKAWLASQFGTSRTKVYRYLSLFKCTEEVLKLEREDVISLDQASRLSAFPHPEQDSIAHEINVAYQKDKEIGTIEINEIIDNAKDKKRSKKEHKSSTQFEKYARQINSFRNRWKKNPLPKGEERDKIITELQQLIGELTDNDE